MTSELSLKEIQKEWHGTLKSYVIGFIASLLLTALFFFSHHKAAFWIYLNLYTYWSGSCTSNSPVDFFLTSRQEAKPVGKQLFFVLRC